jgi:hypothetical protein
MHSRISGRGSPAMVVALAALFFSLGGVAFAHSDKASPYQKRCANGAVRGFVDVIGDQQKGIANFPNEYTSEAKLFEASFSCTGGGVKVKRTDTGVFSVVFPGNPGKVVVGSSRAADSHLAVDRQPDGSFKVVIKGGVGNPQPVDSSFYLVLF